MSKEWFVIDNADTIDTPALALYPDRILQNIRTLKQMAGGDIYKLRPHVKTHKSPDVTRMLLDEGIYKFKCATIAEAEMLAGAGAPDVLLAYQPSYARMVRLGELIRHFPNTTFSCLVDNIATAEMLDGFMTGQHHCLPVFLDLNVGMNRTGITPGDDAFTLYLAMMKMPGLLPSGLHAYDGHLRDPDLSARRKKCDAAFETVLALRDRLVEAEAEEPVIIAGGSPTFPIHVTRSGVECSPGTFIFWDDGYGSILAEQPFLQAALVLTRVISKPAPGLLCLDLGHKAIASENPLDKRVRFLHDTSFVLSGQSEEHLVVKTPHDEQYKVGDLFYGVPYHVCPTVALHDQAFVVSHHEVTGKWYVLARDRFITT